ncbi:hypothetical protein D2W49_35615, partial [Burkholderia pseudomallei]
MPQAARGAATRHAARRATTEVRSTSKRQGDIDDRQTDADRRRLVRGRTRRDVRAARSGDGRARVARA